MSDQETNEGNWNVPAQPSTGEPEPFEHYFMGKWFETIERAYEAPTITGAIIVDTDAEFRYLHSRITELYKYAADVQYLQSELRIVRQELAELRLSWWKRWFL